MTHQQTQKFFFQFLNTLFLCLNCFFQTAQSPSSEAFRVKYCSSLATRFSSSAMGVAGLQGGGSPPISAVLVFLLNEKNRILLLCASIAARLLLGGLRTQPVGHKFRMRLHKTACRGFGRLESVFLIPVHVRFELVRVGVMKTR